ncbi:hypothetical protein, partial [uncultured Lamprocystis sp.]|uniref:hypothetical protein n=1 Tax=uncultured Lamprocystis sp. TaxID=543132 RepID=UPI0025F0A38D
MIAGAADVLKWLRAVQARPELTHAERCAAFALALRINGHTGRLNPSKSTVGADSGTSETVAKRTIAKLQAAELVAVEGSNGRTSNSYALTLPEAPNPAATG